MGVACAFLAQCAVAADSSKDGIGPGKISLPSGPGSIEGLGTAFEPQLNSGTATYGVSIAVPPGVGGLQPSVSLSYNSGSGNSAFGIAWSWEPMKIVRQTSKGFPHYDDSDVFEMGGEELVPLKDGSYRKEHESDFSRITRVGEGWEVRDRSGTRYRLGTTAKSRIHRHGGTFNETFAWYVDEVIDVNGNRMTYTYEKYADSKGAIYCHDIRYSIFGNDCQAVTFDYERRPDSFSSYLSGFEVTTARRCRQIRVTSSDSLVRRYVLEYDADAGADPVASCGMALGFSLLRKVTQYDKRSAVEASYLPPLRFGYTPFDAAKGYCGALSDTPVWSLANPNLVLTDLNCDSLPDFLYTDPESGGHSVCWNLGRGRFSEPVAFAVQPTSVTLDQPGVQLLDMNGDGRADLVQKTGAGYGHFVWYANCAGQPGYDEAHPAWGEEQTVESPNLLPFELDAPDVRSLDLNGDKRMDYMRTTDAGFIYYFNDGDAWHEEGIYLFGEEEMGDITFADALRFCNSDGSPNRHVELADMNGDGLLDLLRWHVFQGTLEAVFWPNCGNGRWGCRTEMSARLELGTTPEDNLRVFDINGDGLADIVAVDYDRLCFWVNRGNNSYTPCFEVSDTPVYIPGQTQLHQADVNGNGSTDFVWENWDAATGGWKLEYWDFIGDARPNLLAAIDNGLGVRTEITYATTTDFYVKARDAGNPWKTKLPFASTVVAKVVKKLGVDFDVLPGEDEQIKEMAYHDGYYDAEEREFRGFAFAKVVERGDDRYQKPGEERTVYSPSRITRTAFHTGEGEPTLKGCPLWVETTLFTADFDGLDNDGDGLVDEDDEGMPSGRFADDDIVFSRTETKWRVREMHGPNGGFVYTNAFGEAVAKYSVPSGTRNGKSVKFPYSCETKETIYEANGRLSVNNSWIPKRSPRVKRTTTEKDFFGNTLWTKDFGEDTGHVDGDEVFTTTEYAFNLDAWILGVPVCERKTDALGHFASATRNYYDGTELWGLAYGKIGKKGRLMRVEQALNGPEAVPPIPAATDLIGDPRYPVDTWITTTRNAYDEYGNIVRTCDAEWRLGLAGHERRFEYDPVFHTYVVGESVVVDESRTFTATATYDYGGGVTLSTTDFNGHTSYAKYDSFFRPVAILRPGDSANLPSQTFSYRLADPRRRIYYLYAPDGRLTVQPTDDSPLVQRQQASQRENALKLGTFDTYTFLDGAGRALGSLREESNGKWACSGVSQYTTLGAAAKAYQPFFTPYLKCPKPQSSHPYTESFYDEAGRVVLTVNPPEAQYGRRTETRTVYLPFETVAYDEEDTNPDSDFYNTPSTTYADGQGRTTSAKSILKNGRYIIDVIVKTGYDALGNVIRLEDAQGNVKISRYDGLGRCYFVHDPDAGRLITTYNDSGTVASTVDNAGREMRFAYDGAGRVISEWPLNSNGVGPNVSYEYDAPTTDYPDFTNLKGELACVRDDSGAEFFSKDALGRVVSRVKRVRYPTTGQMIDYTFGMAYDAMDRVTCLTYPDGDQEVFQFGANGKVTGISNLVESVAYTESDQLSEIRYANGVRTKYTYDLRLRLKALETKISSNTNVVHYAYEYNGVSDILSITDKRDWTRYPAERGDTQVFTYDSLSRLTGYKISDSQTHLANLGQISYAYDLIGNMTRKASTSEDSIGHLERKENGRTVVNLGRMTSGGAAGAYGRTGRNIGDEPGPHALTATEDGRTIRYDDAGNVVELEGMTLEWDFRNRLRSVESVDFRAEFAYDYNGTRMSKHVIAKTAATTNSVTIYPDRTFELRNGNEPTKYAIGGVNRLARFTKMLNPSATCRQWVVLEKGWNFIGLQIQPGGTRSVSSALGGTRSVASANNAASIFALGTSVDSVSRFDPATGKYVDVSADEPIEAGVSYMIHATEPRICEVAGHYAGQTVFSMNAGEQALLLGRAMTVGRLLDAVDAKALMASTGTAADGKAEWQTWRDSLPGNASFLDWRTRPETSLFANLNTAATVDLDDLTPENVLYYHFNHLGSTAAMTDRTGTLFREMQYLPYGQLRAEYGRSAAGGDYGFIGKERDAETGFHYDEARYLAAHLGRFLSVDPIGTDGGMNVYGYTGGNPIGNMDVCGLNEQSSFVFQLEIQKTQTSKVQKYREKFVGGLQDFRDGFIGGRDYYKYHPDSWGLGPAGEAGRLLNVVTGVGAVQNVMMGCIEKDWGKAVLGGAETALTFCGLKILKPLGKPFANTVIPATEKFMARRLSAVNNVINLQDRAFWNSGQQVLGTGTDGIQHAIKNLRIGSGGSNWGRWGSNYNSLCRPNQSIHLNSNSNKSIMDMSYNSTQDLSLNPTVQHQIGGLMEFWRKFRELFPGKKGD